MKPRIYKRSENSPRTRAKALTNRFKLMHPIGIYNELVNEVVSYRTNEQTPNSKQTDACPLCRTTSDSREVYFHLEVLRDQFVVVLVYGVAVLPHH